MLVERMRLRRRLGGADQQRPGAVAPRRWLQLQQPVAHHLRQQPRSRALGQAEFVNDVVERDLVPALFEHSQHAFHAFENAHTVAPSL
ncbi:hypothetical protein D3C72_1668650 [compost metagenome]